MDCGGHKRYHVHGLDSRLLLETYLSDKPEMGFIEDAIRFPLIKLHAIFTRDHVRGDSLVDVSLGSSIHHLFSACEFFKEITLLRVSESCVMELNKWRNTRTGAFDWSHTTSILSSILGNLLSSCPNVNDWFCCVDPEKEPKHMKYRALRKSSDSFPFPIILPSIPHIDKVIAEC